MCALDRRDGEANHEISIVLEGSNLYLVLFTRNQAGIEEAWGCLDEMTMLTIQRGQGLKTSSQEAVRRGHPRIPFASCLLAFIRR